MDQTNTLHTLQYWQDVFHHLKLTDYGMVARHGNKLHKKLTQNNITKTSNK